MRGRLLSALDPGKQGLKLDANKMIEVIDNTLSALDPGKQGLKLFTFSEHPGEIRAFSA